MQSIEDRCALALSFSTRRYITTAATVAIITFAFAVEAFGYARNSSRHGRRPANLSSNRAASAAARNAICNQCESVTKANRKRKLSRAKSSTDAACHAKGYVDPRISGKLNSALRDMKRTGISPKVTSAWRSSQKQAALHRCSQSNRCRRANPGLYRALPAGQSLHEAGFAVDIAGVAAGPRGAKRITPRGRRIVSIMQRNGFRWPYGLKDPAHFEANPRQYGYRSSKQAIARSQSICSARVPTSVAKRAGRSYTTSPVIRRQGSVRTIPARVSNVRTRPRNSRA